MTDDLVPRLRALANAEHDDLSTGDEAADRIIDLNWRIVSLEAELRLIEQRTIERLVSCQCRDCRMVRLDPSIYPVRREMILCPVCGNKRCPHATNHNHECTGSNDPGQPGSEYQFAWSAASETDAAVNRAIERCAEVCDKKRDVCESALALLNEHETVAIACAKSRIRQAEDCAAAIRALKDHQ